MAGLNTFIIPNEDGYACGIFRENGSTKSEFIISVTYDTSGSGNQVVGSLKTVPYKTVENRVTEKHGGGGNFIHVSFGPLVNKGFNNRQLIAEKEIEEILKSGISLQHRDQNQIRKFIFCGHSNSQLKSKSCFFYKADNSDEIQRVISGFGNFSEIKSVEKYAKRIGLLFSNSIISEELNPNETLDIPDIERKGHIFTDGCGLISESFAKKLARKLDSKKIPTDYIPSVFQIRYKGYKGILMVAKDEFVIQKGSQVSEGGFLNSLWHFFKGRLMREKTTVLFRKSMKKFSECPDNTFAILGYSNPTFTGALNSETINLLASNGIPSDVFMRKQREYLEYVRRVDYENREEILEFLKRMNHFDLVKKLEGNPQIPNWIQSKVQELKRSELCKSFNEQNIARVHIQIPAARLLLGVCDISGKLGAGQCYVRITSSDLKGSQVLSGNVIVTRNPCLFPGDIQILHAKDGIPELAYLTDCIVFSTQGDVPAASKLSGGDLDGDKFFVSWDNDLVRMENKNPLNYSALAPKTRTVPEITWEMRIQYFAHYSTQLGEIMSLYWKWNNAYPKLRANSGQCKSLSQLYARCVDGEKVFIPVNLRNPPSPQDSSDGILDLLKRNVKTIADNRTFHEYLNSAVGIRSNSDLQPEDLQGIGDGSLSLQNGNHEGSPRKLAQRYLKSVWSMSKALCHWVYLLLFNLLYVFARACRILYVFARICSMLYHTLSFIARITVRVFNKGKQCFWDERPSRPRQYVRGGRSRSSNRRSNHNPVLMNESGVFDQIFQMLWWILVILACFVAFAYFFLGNKRIIEWIS